MLIVTVLYKGNKEEFLDHIYSVKSYLENKNINIGIYEDREKDFNIIKIFSPDENISKKSIESIYINVAEAIYKFIMRKFYNKEIDYIINDNYFFLTNEEVEEIKIKLASVVIDYGDINDENTVYCINRVNEIKDDILQVLRENNEINIEGYLTFRLKEIRKKIGIIIDKIIQETMVEKEYNEFIKLLKYFVQMQDSKMNMLNIFVTSEGGYIISDDSGNNIMEEFENREDLEYIDESIEIEDVIISGLVTNSPKNIIIHGIHNCRNEQFINTIKNVFEGRVQICNGCEQCNTILNKNCPK